MYVMNGAWKVGKWTFSKPEPFPPRASPGRFGSNKRKRASDQIHVLSGNYRAGMDLGGHDTSVELWRQIAIGQCTAMSTLFISSRVQPNYAAIAFFEFRAISALVEPYQLLQNEWWFSLMSGDS